MTHALRVYRAERDISIDALATRAGIDKGLLSKIERGLIQQPRPGTIRKLIAATDGALGFRDFLPSDQNDAPRPQAHADDGGAAARLEP